MRKVLFRISLRGLRRLIRDKRTEQNRTYLLFTPRYSKYTTWANEIINMNMPFVQTAYVVALIRGKNKKKKKL